MLFRFFRSEPAAANVLFCAAAIAMIVANSPMSAANVSALESSILGISVHHWINDGLMALFFLLVGLEIKQEVLTGALSSWRSRALPAAADIALAIGVLALLGPRVPPALRILLVGSTLIDNLGAIVIIVWCYTASVSMAWLGLAAVGIAVLVVFNRR